MKIDKELIGVLGDWPVYKVLDGNFTEIPFTVNFRTLIIGDGDNSPQIFVKDALKAMFHYILEESAFDLDMYADWNIDIEPTDKELLHYIVFDHDNRGHFYYHNFSTQHHIEFQNMCKNKLLKFPYNEKIDGVFNKWLHVNIGSFIWFYYSDLTELNAFSPYDYFVENYLENVTICKKSNIVGITEGKSHFQHLVEPNKRKITSHPIIAKDELDYLGNEVWAGNNWGLDNVYYFYLNIVKK